MTARSDRRDPMLTALIPTYADHSPLLERALHYYATVGFPYPIVVVDSSSPETRQLNKRLVERFKGSLALAHQDHPPARDFYGKVADAVAAVETPYVVLSGDDDFLVPGALEECVAILATHAECSAVGGLEVGLSTWSASGISGQSRDGVSVEGDDPAGRLVDHYSTYTPTLYCTRRREEFAETFSATHTHGGSLLLCELLESGLTVIKGKGRSLDELYMVRQGHKSPEQRISARGPGWPEMTSAPDFPDRAKRFCAYLARALNGVGVRDAGAVADDAFGRYLRQFEPGTRSDAQRARRVKRLAGNQVVAQLLHPDSPFHAQFRVTYDHIVRWPEGIT